MNRVSMVASHNLFLPDRDVPMGSLGASCPQIFSNLQENCSLACRNAWCILCTNDKISENFIIVKLKLYMEYL